jgi:hypothetical protein
VSSAAPHTLLGHISARQDLRMATISDRLDAILTSSNHSALDEAVEMCKREFAKQQPEPAADGLLDKLLDGDHGPWAKRYLVLTSMVYCEPVRQWLAEGCERARFEPFWLYVRDHVQIYARRQASLGVPPAEGQEPLYADVVHFVAEMCMLYSMEFDYEGKWNAMARATEQRRTLYD